MSQPTLAFVRQLPGSDWAQFRLTTTARTVDVYLMRDDHPKPVVVLLQGSGCLPLFTVDWQGGFHSTTIFEDAVKAERDEFHFAMVEKQGVVPLAFAKGMTPDEQAKRFREVQNGACRPEYFKNETLPVRADDAFAAVQALSTESWVKAEFVVGHSEGSHVASAVVQRDRARKVAAVGLFSSAGPTQFFEGTESREAFEQEFNDMRMLQQADGATMYQGHAARRWKTYALDTTALDDVRNSVTPLYVAQGERDHNTHAADLFVLEALRLQPARPLRYVVVHDGDHGFETSDHRDYFSQVFKDFLSWGLNPQRATGVEILK
jgi:pimeloyl-ACP methyl ester carboxylesterase